MTLEILELCKEGFVFKDLNEVMVLKRSYVQKQRELRCNQHLFSNLAVKHHSIRLTTDESGCQVNNMLRCTDVYVLLLILPDEEELSHGKIYAMNLGDEYGGYCLIKCRSIQGQRGRHGDHYTRQLFVHVEIILQAADCDRQSHNTGRKKYFRLSSNPVFA